MSQPPAKRRRVELSLKDKVKLIQESERHPKPSQKVFIFLKTSYNNSFEAKFISV